ncbi:MAG: DnaB-like helicase C-terminal domain-containing protein [Bacteroidales bacterium]
MEQDVIAPEQEAVLEFSRSSDIVNQALKTHIIHSNGSAVSAGAVPSGFYSLDQKTSGFKKAELTAIAVRKGMGKTSFLLSLINNIAIKQKRAVAVFSSERSAGRIIQRLIETETGFSMNKIRNNSLSESQQEHAKTLINIISDAEIFINDNPKPAVETIAKQSRLLAKKNKPEVIFVDYLEMLAANIHEPVSRQEEYRHILQELQNLSEELNIPVIVFTQIPGHQSANTPSARDVSDELKEKVKNLMLLHRNNMKDTKHTHQPKGYAELLIEKDSRLEKQGKVGIRFIESIDKFVNLQ